MLSVCACGDLFSLLNEEKVKCFVEDAATSGNTSVGQVECKRYGYMLSKSAWWLSPLLWWKVGHACSEG